MSLKSIQDKLNSDFTGSKRILVFWYDENSEFASEIKELRLNNAKIYELSKDNWFYTKYFFETIDTENNYLVYAPFPKPSDKDNHLADMIYYSKQFFADKISLVCQDLKIIDKYKEHLREYPKFWNAKERIAKFGALEIENYNNEIIDIGLMAVLVNSKIANFDEILKTIIIDGEYKDNKYINIFDNMGILSAFWELCKRYYSFNDQNPTLTKLVASLAVTYTAFKMDGSLPKAWQPYLLDKKNDVAVFIGNLMNNILHKDAFDIIAHDLEKLMKAKDNYKDIQVENYYRCDTFATFDINIVEYITELLVSKHPSPWKMTKVISDRSKTHFWGKYKRYYELLLHAETLINMIKEIDLSILSSVDDILRTYIKEWSLIDQSYRKFYYNYDRIDATETISKLRNMVENTYTNAYLSKTSNTWSDKIDGLQRFIDINGTKQQDFYQKFVQPVIDKERTVVIISDAFRYECAIELQEEFTQNAKYSSEISHMISNVPSFTQLGMASLLPHKRITIKSDFNINVDGKIITNMEQRNILLKSYNEQSVAFSYSEIMAMSKDQLRMAISDQQKLIYVYHNQIDARGDHGATENEVFTACREAIEEIMKIINKLTNNKSIVNYIITSDHGFIYKRDKLDESDKVDLKIGKDIYLNKRFILSHEKINMLGMLDYSLDYLSEESVPLYVMVPRGVDIFKAQGGGQNYVHGGASLQEIVIPVLKVRSTYRKTETSNVQVVLTSLSRKITNLITSIDFIQTENISDVFLPVELKIYMENEAGDRISGENIIVANKKNESPENRVFREKITLRNKHYTKKEKYFLIMKDINADMEVARYEYIIDIAFADDFGFEV